MKNEGGCQRKRKGKLAIVRVRILTRTDPGSPRRGGSTTPGACRRPCRRGVCSPTRPSPGRAQAIRAAGSCAASASSRCPCYPRRCGARATPPVPRARTPTAPGPQRSSRSPPPQQQQQPSWPTQGSEGRDPPSTPRKRAVPLKFAAPSQPLPTAPSPLHSAPDPLSVRRERERGRGVPLTALGRGDSTRPPPR